MLFTNITVSEDIPAWSSLFKLSDLPTPYRQVRSVVANNVACYNEANDLNSWNSQSSFPAGNWNILLIYVCAD